MRVGAVRTYGAGPHREPAPWVRVTLNGLLVAGLILLSSWLFRG